MPTTLTPQTTEASREDLRALAAAHRVTCEVYPERRAQHGGLEQVGFSLELLGSHDHPERAPVPGCSECIRVYRDLERIAAFVVPRENRPTEVEIAPYEPTLIVGRSVRDASRVRLTMRLVHRVGVEGGVDDCERRCLAEVKEGLRELGIAVSGV